jgi:hypothetical protein
MDNGLQSFCLCKWIQRAKQGGTVISVMLHSTAQEPLLDGKSFDFATRISEIDTVLRPKGLVVVLYTTRIDRLWTTDCSLSASASEFRAKQGGRRHNPTLWFVVQPEYLTFSLYWLFLHISVVCITFSHDWMTETARKIWFCYWR